MVKASFYNNIWPLLSPVVEPMPCDKPDVIYFPCIEQNKSFIGQKDKRHLQIPDLRAWIPIFRPWGSTTWLQEGMALCHPCMRHSHVAGVIKHGARWAPCQTPGCEASRCLTTIIPDVVGYISSELVVALSQGVLGPRFNHTWYKRLKTQQFLLIG